MHDSRFKTISSQDDKLEVLGDSEWKDGQAWLSSRLTQTPRGYPRMFSLLSTSNENNLIVVNFVVALAQF